MMSHDIDKWLLESDRYHWSPQRQGCVCPSHLTGVCLIHSDLHLLPKIAPARPTSCPSRYLVCGQDSSHSEVHQTRDIHWTSGATRARGAVPHFRSDEGGLLALSLPQLLQFRTFFKLSQEGTSPAGERGRGAAGPAVGVQCRAWHAANRVVRWCVVSLSHSGRHFTQLRQHTHTHTRLYSNVLGTAQATTI